MWAREKTQSILNRSLMVLSCLLLLELAVSAQWVSPLFFAKPSAALRTLWSQLANGKIAGMVFITLYEIGFAFLLATLLGLLLGYLLWRYRILGLSYELLLSSLFASPLILLYPLFLVAFGRTSAAIIALAALFGLIPIAINTRSALDHVNPVLIQVGSSMNLLPRQIFRHILIPAAAPAVFSGFRLGLTYILKTILGMEFIVNVGGIGKWISEAAFRFETEEIYAGLFGVLILSVAFLHLLDRMERWIRR